jgi:hypothetical protein
MSLNWSWMYGSRIYNEYIKGLDVFIDFMKKDMLDNVRGAFVVLVNIARMRRNIIHVMCWGHIWSSMDSWMIIDVGINMGRNDLIKQMWEIHIWRGRSLHVSKKSIMMWTLIVSHGLSAFFHWHGPQSTRCKTLLVLLTKSFSSLIITLHKKCPMLFILIELHETPGFGKYSQLYTSFKQFLLVVAHQV